MPESIKVKFEANHEGAIVSEEYDEAGLLNGTLTKFVPGYGSEVAMLATVIEPDGYARGIAKKTKTEWKFGQEAWWAGAIYLPKGFFTAKQGQIDILRWDNFDQDATTTERGGIVMQTTDRKFRLVRIKEGEPDEQKTLNLSGETVIGPEIVEGRWYWVEVRQVLHNKTGAAINELWIDGEKVFESTTANCIRSDLEVSRYRVGIAATNGKQTNDISIAVDRIWAGPEKKGKISILSPILESNTSKQSKWTYVLCKLDGTSIGELQNATERSLTIGLNRPAVASATITVTNELLPNLFGEDTILQVWEDKTLRFYGYVLTPELTAGEQMPGTVKLNAADPAWRLTRRVLGKSKGGTNFAGDKAESTKKMIDELNAAGETGIKTQAVASGSSGTYVAGPYKEALTCINDLAHGFDGFDWYMSPVEGAEPKLGLYEADPTFGEERKNTVFEFGWGQNNVRALTYMRDKSNLTNRAFHLPDEGLETGEALSKEDATSITAHGLYEEVTDGFGLVDTTLRNKWLEEVVRVKKNPRFVAGMTLDIQDDTGRVPQVGVDFWLGDIVQARAVVENMTLFNGKVRVYQIKFDINDNGIATITPILVEEGT